jgi:predicted metalloprotease with PDZ domain
VASLVSNDPQGFSGDYFASTHLQGELIGTMLDILIRSETGNKRSFDDVMRLMFDRFGGERGFQAGDIEQCCKQVCPVAEEQITAFFQQYIEKGLPLEFNPFLARMGLKLDISYRKAIDEQGHERVDRRMYIWKPADDSVYSIHIMHPNSCWARAGLHTGDRLLSIDGIPLKKRAEFNQWFGELKTGDQPSMGVLGQDGYHEIKILIEPYFAPVVRISKVPNPSPGTLALLEKWTSGE